MHSRQNSEGLEDRKDDHEDEGDLFLFPHVELQRWMDGASETFLDELKGESHQ